MTPRYITYFLTIVSLYIILRGFLELRIPSAIFHIALYSSFSSILLLRLFQNIWLKRDKAAKADQIILKIKPVLPIVIPFFASFITFFVYVAIDEGWSSILRYIDNLEIYLIILGISILLLFAFFGTPHIFKHLAKSKNHYISDLAGSFLNNNLFFTGTSYTKTPVPLELAKVDLELAKVDMFSAEILEQIMPGIPKNRTVVITDLRSRAHKLQMINGLILVFIVLVLVVAAIFIVFAGEIASKDTQSISLLQTALNSRSQIESSLKILEEEQVKLIIKKENGKRKEASLNDKIKQINSAEKTKFSKEELIKAKTELDKVHDENTDLSSRLDLIQNQITRKKEELTTANDILKSIREKAIDTGVKDLDPITGVNLLIAAGITRFGVLAITIYLVQILLNLYRYNVRVSGFYLSRADALTIIDHSAKKIQDISNNLAPGIDFGKQPVTLLEKFSENLATLIDKSVAQAFKVRDKKKDIV